MPPGAITGMNDLMETIDTIKLLLQWWPIASSWRDFCLAAGMGSDLSGAQCCERHKIPRGCKNLSCRLPSPGSYNWSNLIYSTCPRRCLFVLTNATSSWLIKLIKTLQLMDPYERFPAPKCLIKYLSPVEKFQLKGNLLLSGLAWPIARLSPN